MPAVRSTAVVAVVLLLVGLVSPVGAATGELERARESRRALQAQLDDAAAALAELQAREAALEDRRADLLAEQRALTDEIERARDRVAGRVREAYKHGAAAPVLLVLAGGEVGDVVARAQIVDRLTRADAVAMERAVAARTERAVVGERLASTRADLDRRRREQEAVEQRLATDLEQARALEQRLEAEARRREEARRRREEQAAAQRPAPVRSSGTTACPVADPRSFTDTWGAPRSGGRSHRGTDILAPMGNPVIAIVDGVWDIYPPGRNAGKWAILRGVDGTSYWYLHLQRHLVGDGARVAAGQQVATNGDTGNARGGPPHVHFELHPGGGSAVNPYPTLRRICGR